MTNRSNNSEFARLQKELEGKLDWGQPNEWHSSMFTELSEKIYDSANVMLSPTTLKRFFGVVNHDGAPSITTLDALSAFLGYKNWRAFKISKKNRLRLFAKGVSNRSLYISFGFVLAIFTIILISNKTPESEELPVGITFSSRPVTNTYPNSVVFDFNLKEVFSDDIHIQQYWDPTKTFEIEPEQKQATGIYYFPGYFRAKLLVDGNIVKQHDLFLRSNGWLGTIEYDPVPKYFAPKTLKNNTLMCPDGIVDEISLSDRPLTSVYHYVNDLGNISGDNFDFETNLRISYSEKWAICEAVQIYIIGTQGAMIIPFSKMGCISDNNLMLNDIYLSGKENDLSAFGSELNEFTKIKIEVKSQTVSIFRNDSNIYNKTYQNSMGRLVGFRYKFLGIGEVKDYSLKDQYGNPITL